jgi:hypothetical protein
LSWPGKKYTLANRCAIKSSRNVAHGQVTEIPDSNSLHLWLLAPLELPVASYTHSEISVSNFCPDSRESTLLAAEENLVGELLLHVAERMFGG